MRDKGTMALTVESTIQGKAAVVHLSGRVDEKGAPEFESACAKHLSNGMTHVVLDLSELQYVSSMGIRSFIRLKKLAEEQGGALLLCGLKGFVKEVFDVTHVTELFPLFDSTDAALASI